MDPIDRLPPQCLDVERAVLGACLLNDQDAIGAARRMLRVESFYATAHRLIWQAIVRLHDRNEPADQITVTQELTKSGDLDRVGGIVGVALLAGGTGTSANVEYHASIVAKAHLRRTIIAQATQLIERCYDPSQEEAELAPLVEFILPELGMGAGVAWENVADTTNRAYGLISEAMDRRGELGGVSTGLTDLDDMLDGLHPSDFVIVASRPSMGKTALGINIAWAASRFVGVGFVTVEMSTTSISNRLLSLVSGVDSQALRRGRITVDEYRTLSSASVTIRQRPIFLSNSLRNPSQIHREARRLKSQYGISLLLVDYLQLLDAPGYSDNREQEVASISRMLKNTAHDLGLPVVAMAQINRKSEMRSDKRPLLSDLRESGGIEADADVVILLHRPAYYGAKEVDGRNVERLMEAHVAKQRNGPVGMVELFFDAPTGKISNLEDRRESPEF